MKKFSKVRQQELESWIGDLRVRAGNIESAYDSYEEALIKLNEAIDEYNGVLGSVTEWRGEIVGDMETYVDERSEKWQESDAGQNYQAWKDEWDGIGLDEVEQFELLEMPAPEHADTLESLPTEPDA